MKRREKPTEKNPKNGSPKRSSTSRKSTEQTSKRKAAEREIPDSGADDQPLLEAEQSYPKTVKKPRITSQDGDSDDTSAKLQVNSEGDKYVDLGKKRRVTVRSFKGATLVDIREYYGAEGDEKPGKKGISLTVEQWKSLMEASGDINDLL
ncbi:transcriptional Coactivator p15-domain-containing protein [Lactifluus subvellereus]|nr:transcriptional Coactivator p15-domain-containing protein [Lactifluus subvellereus]